MSRNLSEAHIRAANAAQTDECWCTLIVIEHASLAEPLRFTNVGAAIESNGHTYHHFPFDITLFSDDEESHPYARLVIDNTSREIVAEVRKLRPEPTVQISVVLASNPDVVELEYPALPLSNLTYDLHTVEGIISAEDFTGEPVPGGRITPAAFPGLF